MEELAGRQLGPYRVISLVGKGGMAAVYKAYQPSMDRYVALKILPRQMAADPQFTARFENEARLLARLQHPYILPVFDYGQAEGYAYFIMPLVETGTLAQALRGRPLPVERICEYTIEIGEALEYAHARGLLHRDVKPSNVLMDESGNCVLTDFGIAKLVDDSSNLTATGTLIGTPAYMSPEQGRGQELDRRSDIYSLGVIMYEMATGRVPFSATTPVAVIFKHIQEPLPPIEQVNPSLPTGLVNIINTALAKRPEDRFQTARDLVEAVQAAAADLRGSRVLPATMLEPAPIPPPVIAPERPPSGSYPRPSSPSTVPPGPPPSMISGTSAQPAPGALPAAPAARRGGLGGGALLGLGGLVGLGGLFVILLLCAAIFFAPRLFGAQPAATTPGPATRTPAPTSAEATATERPARTPTPDIEVTTAVRPSPTFVLLPTSSVPGVLFQDDFETDTGWGTGDGDDSLVELRDGALAIEIYETRWRVPSLAAAGELQDVHFQVTVRSVGAEDDPPIVGVICHSQSDGAYYYLGFSPDGYYGIAYFDGTEGQILSSDENAWQASDDIVPFAEEYLLEADCLADGTLRLMVDGTEIASLVDNTLLSGQIGVFASSFDAVPAEVYFDDLVVSQPGAGGVEVLYSDDFEDDNSGWDITSSDLRTIGYRDGTYYYEIFEPGWRITSYAEAGDLPPSRLSVTVGARGEATDPGFGLLCHVQADGAYYYFGFGPDGYYAIGYYDGESSTLLTNTTNDWQFSDDVALYADSYLMEAECGADGTLRLFVDGIEIASVADTTLTSGDVGLFASSFEEVPVEVFFDNFLVVTLP
jgi:serine/threonine protein kinase